MGEYATGLGVDIFPGTTGSQVNLIFLKTIQFQKIIERWGRRREI